VQKDTGKFRLKEKGRESNQEAFCPVLFNESRIVFPSALSFLTSSLKLFIPCFPALICVDRPAVFQRDTYRGS
jgi:hypothetical protein